MKGMRLCRGALAATPYFIRNIGVNAFSIEEICYYMQHYPELIDKTLMEPSLPAWFSEELGMTRLAQTLELAIAARSGAADFAMPVFREITYLSRDEMLEFERRVTFLEKLSGPERMKRKGDALVRCGRQGGAIKVYRQILEEKEEKLSPAFRASIWHNMGVAQLKMLQYEEALPCFKKAYDAQRTSRTLRSYLMAFAMTRPDEKFREELAVQGVDEKTAQSIRAELAAANEAELEDAVPDVKACLSALAEDYHRATGL